MRTRALILAVVMVFAVGMAVAQSSSSQSSSSSNPSAQSSQQQTSTTTDQTSTTQSTTPSANSGAAATNNDQSPAAADQNANGQTSSARKGKLPQTASPLPLLGLLGMGSLAVGAVSRRRKK